MYRKKRVIILASCHRIGGFETKLDMLIRYLDKSRFELILILIYPHYKAKKLHRSVQEKYRLFLTWPDIVTEELTMKTRFDVFVVFQAVRIMKKYKADLMYFFALGAGTFIAPVSGKLSNIPILIRANDTIVKGLYPSVLKFLDRLLIKITDLIVVPSLFLKNLMVEELSIDSTKISVIPNAIDLAPFRGKKNRVSAKNSLGISKDTKVIGMVANLLPVKAPDVLIRAVPEVVKKTPDTVFVLAGDGPLQPDLELLAENLRVSKHVRFLGYRSDIADVVAAFDIGVMCSKVETHGISILEMMAAGVPVIAPEVGGIPEIIRHEENGFLLPQGDSDRLAEAIVRLLKRSDFAREMGKRAHEMVFDHFSVDRMVYSMEQLFLEFS